MRWMHQLRRRVRLLVDRASVEREMDEEMRFHLAMQANEHRAHGLAHGDAERHARRQFGGVARHKDDARDARGGAWIDGARQDLAYAVRVLRRAPVYTCVAGITLALGIGANAALFSVIDGVLLRPLPYPEPERLVVVSSTFQGSAAASSPRDFLDWRNEARSFTGMAAHYMSTVNLTGQGDAARLTQARVSDNFFDLLRMPPVLGRGFVQGEDAEGAPRVVVLSDALWRGRFGADPGVVGRTITLDGFPTTVVGVAPAALQFPDRVDLWLPTRFSARDVAESARGARWVGVVGRLAPGADVDQARAEMSSIARGLEQKDPRHNEGFGARVTPVLESAVGELRRPLYILLGAVGFVLLIACANVASLTLGRVASRESELAVRTALGAGKGRIVRQVLTESAVLAIVGGVAGILLAALGIRALAALAPGGIPRMTEVGLDGRVIAFSLLATMLTALLFGLPPAIAASRGDLHGRLKAGARGADARPASARARRALVVAQVALSLVLLAGAGLLLRSFARLQAVDPGFRPEGMSTFSVTLSPVKYATRQQQRTFTDELLAKVRAVPGVQLAAATFGLPMSGQSFGLTFEIAGRAPQSGPDEPRAQVRMVTPDYFQTMGIRLLRGRAFDERDREGSVPAIIISETTARRHWPNEEPIGQRVTTGWERDGVRLGGIVVGIVSDVRQYSLEGQPSRHVYAPLAQWPIDEVTVVARGRSAPSAVLGAAGAIVREIDSDLPVYDARPVAELVERTLGSRRFYLVLLATFAGVALVLAAVGVYGVVAYAVQQRGREIGIRIALGAGAERVVLMVLRHGAMLVGLGIVLGTVGALGLTRLLRGLLFEVTPTDPVALGAAPVALTLVALLACAIPARRAARQDPSVAMRGE